jgi:hypothetical protein
MDTPLKTAGCEELLSIPLDLSEWVPVLQLREWIMSDVATLNWTNAELMEVLRQNPEFEPKALLNTMVLAYATGIFTADEIARRCSTDIEFRAVRPKLPPIPAEVKAFRKENRGVFKWCLAKVITRALKTQFVDGDRIEILPAGLRRHVVENAVERLELARHLDRSGEL